MTRNLSSKLLSPAITLMNRLSFAKKFALLGLISLAAICVTLYSLYINLNQEIRHSQKELEGLKLIHPLAKAVQLVQQHRGLSSGILSGISDLEPAREMKELDAEAVFVDVEKRLPDGIRQLESWKNITANWKRIRTNGLQWSLDDNFTAHAQLIEDLLLYESVVTDDYGLTADPDIGTFYLAHTLSDELLGALEQLGQIRAKGVGILGTKQISVQQKVQMNTLLELLHCKLKPLKINMEKAAKFNPAIKSTLSATYDNFNKSSHLVSEYVLSDILTGHFSISPDKFFADTTVAIDNGYTQLYQVMLPTTERLIKARIRHAETALQFTTGIALLFLLAVLYFMVAIYRTTLGSIQTLSQSVTGFVRGNMQDRVHLETHDELGQIGDSFNEMADELTESLKARQAALDVLQKIADRVPGVVYQYRLRPDGSSCFPFASEAIREICRVSPEEVREDASRIFAIIHPDDLANVAASIQTSGRDLTQWSYEYRVKFADGTVNWLLGMAMPEREADGSTLWHGFITDTTELRLVEEALHRSETMLRTLYESTSDAVMLVGEKGFLDCNKATLVMFGCATVDEFCTRHPSDISPPKQPSGGDSKTLADQNNATAIKMGSHHFEWICQRIDTCTTFPADVLLNRMRLDGRVILQATVRDITESKKWAFQLEKLSFALNHLNQAVYLMNENGCFNYVNDEACRVLGYTREELIGKMGVPDIGQGWTDEMWAEHWLDVKLNGFRILEAAHRTKDGRIFPIEVSANFFEYDGQSYIMSMVRDITERKQAEDKLRKLSLAVEQSPSSIVITDLNANIEYVNQAFVKETGYSFDEAVGQNPRVLSSGKNRKAIYEEMWACLKRGEAWKGELINRRKDGSEYIESALISPVHQADGRVTHYLAIKENITQRKRNESKMERLTRIYHLLSQVNEAIVRAHDKNELFAAICNASIVSGLFRFAWVGLLDEQRLAVIPFAYAGVEDGYMEKVKIRLDDERTGNGPIARAIRMGTPVVIQNIENDPSMAPWRDEALRRGYHASAAFPLYEAGNVAGTINVYAVDVHFFTPDITQLMQELAADVSFALDVFAEKIRRELAEDEIIKLNVELEHRVVERTRQLEAANRELEAFSYSVSHDLRAPLRSIDGFSRNLSRKYHDQLDATGQDWLDRVCRASQHMGRLIDDMLQLSQVARGPLNRELVDLSKIAENVAEGLKNTNPERQVQFVLQQGLSVLADTGLLRIVMDNLLSNAYKFTGKKSDAKIEFGECDIEGERVFFVRDNGDGFNMNYAGKLFGAFQRLHSVNEFDGTGIGLATVQRVIHRHNGKVWAEAIEGQGATLYFTLPQRERGGLLNMMRKNE